MYKQCLALGKKMMQTIMEKTNTLNILLGEGEGGETKAYPPPPHANNTHAIQYFIQTPSQLRTLMN